MLGFLAPLLGSSLGGGMMSSMASSMIMGGINGLLGGGGGGGAGGSAIPSTPNGMAQGVAPKFRDAVDLTQGRSMMADGGLAELAKMLNIQGGGSIGAVDGGGYAGGGGGRVGVDIPAFNGTLSAGVSGDMSGYNVGPYSDFEKRVSGGDVGYSASDGTSYGASYSEDPMMSGETDRRLMLNYSTPFSNGGVASLSGMEEGGMIRGSGSGVDDEVAGSIDNRQDVLLSDGEFVVPARVVSALGDGSSEYGAKILHEMISRVKAEADDRLKDNEKINLKKVLPA